MTGRTGLTLAGLAIVLVVLWANLRPWWRGDRDPAKLKSFGTGSLLGALATMCGGGVLGWLAGCAPTLANNGGGKGVQGVTGQTPQATVTQGALGQLTPEGAVIVFLVFCGTIFAYRSAGKDERKRMVGGIFCGVCLCLTAGVASALNWVPDLVNQGGTVLVDGIEGAGLL
ncbi:hypothetical protein GKQ77_01725 [Streptomyces sp. BG9H]|uniref:Uncharacterized protein n=1 Tax=Streptomyces anatolicus TaxID=2675858 RepID=A0ABS6YFV4_9ACTN|nr:hypothetical protein [Streptomyces anatolicus]MBW5420290.1 hypothetical protein [Streptomyces anatolicus]